MTQYVPAEIGADVPGAGREPIASSVDFGGLAAFAAKTEADWRNELQVAETDRWGRVNTGLRGDLDPNLPVVVAIMKWIADKLGLTGALNTLAEIGAAIAQWVADRVDDAGGIISGVVGDVVDGSTAFIEYLLGLMGFGDPMDRLGTGSLTPVNPELLYNPGFDNDKSMPQAGGWTWDGTVDHNDDPKSGSAKVVADGSLKLMISNAVKVASSNYLEASVWVKWTARSGSGPVSLKLNIYDANDTLLDSPVLGGITTGASGSWTQLSGTYTIGDYVAGKVPSHVALCFEVDPQNTAGNFWWDDASLKKINPISHQLVDGFQDAIDDFTGTVGGGLNDFVQGLKNFDLINTGTILDDFVPGVGYLLESGIRGLFSLPPATDIEYTHEEFLRATYSTAESATGNASELNKIWQYLLAGPYDEFERFDLSGLGSNWSAQWGFGNSKMLCDNHNVVLPYAWPGGNAEWSSYWTGSNASSATDYQVVSIVLGSASTRSLIGECGHNDVLARVGGSKDYVRFRVGGDGSWSLKKFVNATTEVDAFGMGPNSFGLAGSIAAPGAGSAITVYAGNVETSELRRWKVTINNTVICDFVEPTVSGVPASAAGASYRKRGFGMRAENSIPFLTFGWLVPGMVNYWTSYDQPPPGS